MMPNLSHEQIERNFAEIAPRMSEVEAKIEANRCLYCFDAPCTQACPTHINVPAFIKKIATDNLKGSARVIFDANPIGGSCARVCPVEVLCEGACVEKSLVDKPIEIGRLQRFATDYAVGTGEELFPRCELNGKSIAIVGSGPAGLSCASYLARLGYAVTIYEKKDLPGGLDTYGMAEYKLTQSQSLAEVSMIEAMGVKFLLNVAVVCDAKTNDEISINALLERYDAVFLAIGLGKTKRLQIPGEEKKGVFDALEFIEKIKTREWGSIEIGKKVAVIGAGNTAIDAVTQAKRLGAETAVIVYRKMERDAPAYDYEIALAKSDAAEFEWDATPCEIIGGEFVEGLRCKRLDGSEFEISCGIVIKAIGQEKQTNFISELGVKTDDNGRVLVNELMQTSKANLFAGGDCVNGGGEAVNAAQMGKQAASGIHECLSGERVKFEGA